MLLRSTSPEIPKEVVIPSPLDEGLEWLHKSIWKWLTPVTPVAGPNPNSLVRPNSPVALYNPSTYSIEQPEVSSGQFFYSNTQPEVPEVPPLQVPDIRNPAVLEQIKSFPKPSLIQNREAPAQKEDALPALEPYPKPLVKVKDPGTIDCLSTIEDFQRSAYDLLKSKPRFPFEVDIGRYPQGKSEADIQRDLRADHLDAVVLSDWKAPIYNNKWNWYETLIDYETIRFSSWTARWPVNRRLAILQGELGRLRRIKIYGLSKDLMTILLKNLAEFTLIIQIEIDELVIDTLDARLGQTPVLNFRLLRVLSIGNVNLMCQHGIAGYKWQTWHSKYLIIAAPNLDVLYLYSDAIRWIDFPKSNLRQLMTFQLSMVIDLTKPPFGSNLHYLECNRAELVNVQLLAEIACDNKVLPQLEFLLINCGELLSTSDRPTPEQLKYFEQLFDLIKTRGVRTTETSRGFSLFFNHVHMNPVLTPTTTSAGQIVQPVMQLCDLHFDQPLVVCLYLNFTKNRLSIYLRTATHTTEYLDVLRSFFHLKPRVPLPPSLKIIGFEAFACHFPQIQIVTLHNENREAMPDALPFIYFLKELRGLQKLFLHCTGFSDAEFYSHLSHIVSLRTLHTLEVFDRRGEFSDQIDFSFLASFVYLRRFATNLVLSERLRYFPYMMRMASHFSFEFWHESFDEDEFAEVSFKRINYCQFELTIAERKDSDPGFQRVYHEQFFDESKQKMCLDLRNFPIHWLDSLQEQQTYSSEHSKLASVISM